jgi:hypothetical protein
LEPKPDSEPDSESDPESEHKPDPEPEPGLEPKLDPEPDPESEPGLEPKLDPEPDPEPDRCKMSTFLGLFLKVEEAGTTTNINIYIFQYVVITIFIAASTLYSDRVP